MSKINLSHSGSYIDFPDRIKSKKAKINAINKKDNKCFQYAETVALNAEIGRDPEWITKIKPFISKYVWEGINCALEKRWLEKNWEK